MSGGRICIAEGDVELQTRLRVALRKNGFEVTSFDSGYPIVEMPVSLEKVIEKIREFLPVEKMD